MYFVQQQTTTQNHITIFGMIIMEFKMEKNEPRYATVKNVGDIFGVLVERMVKGCEAAISVTNISNLSPTLLLPGDIAHTPKSETKIDVTVKLFCSIWQVFGLTVSGTK